MRFWPLGASTKMQIYWLLGNKSRHVHKSMLWWTGVGGKCLLDRKGSEIFIEQKFAWDSLELWDQADAQKIFGLFCCLFFFFCLHVYLNGMSIGASCPRLVCELPDIMLALFKWLERQYRRSLSLPRNLSRCNSSKECFIKTVIKFTRWITRICSLPVATVTKKRNSTFILMKSS